MPNVYGFYDISVPPAAIGLQTWIPTKVTRRGEQRIMDFFTEMLMEGRGYQIRSGTITTGIATETGITDTQSEMCVDAALGLTQIPVNFHMAVRSVATALTFQAYVKAVGAASSAGTAFTPLPLRQGGAGSSTTARVAAAGAVTVAAELATTTRRLFEHQNAMTEAPTTINDNLFSVGIQASASQLRYIGDGVSCVYIQLAAATAAPLYMATLDYLELLTSSIG